MLFIIKEVGVKDSWLPQLIGAIGALIPLKSLLGFLGAFWNSAAALAINGGAQGMLALAVVVLGSVCLADAKNSVLALLALLVADQAAIIYMCTYIYACLPA